MELISVFPVEATSEGEDTDKPIGQGLTEVSTRLQNAYSSEDDNTSAFHGMVQDDIFPGGIDTVLFDYNLQNASYNRGQDRQL